MDNIEAVKILKPLTELKDGYMPIISRQEQVEAIEFAIEKLESERTGHWETPEPDYDKDGTRLLSRVAICSECQKPNKLPVGRYCSNCGSYNAGGGTD